MQADKAKQAYRKMKVILRNNMAVVIQVASVIPYDKLSQIGRHGPGPSDMVVFTDENADTIDDGFFIQYVGLPLVNGKIWQAVTIPGAIP